MCGACNRRRRVLVYSVSPSWLRFTSLRQGQNRIKNLSTCMVVTTLCLKQLSANRMFVERLFAYNPAVRVPKRSPRQERCGSERQSLSAHFRLDCGVQSELALESKVEEGAVTFWALRRAWALLR
ncbi:hypothetical protein CALVIDRAFT_149466 [Calocera viscosa TUFC12733]|uniref:Uncharacterized protein n=1 Tax=Calocera viscosa (strain TUFC12733) TaxID=1330018 RepID=A0A167LHU8_CALVF|nr:hypothetical protein CALVIDRAFT_149466 [Calocera viscosa TUFC12733]